jgi:hypothetical protein
MANAFTLAMGKSGSSDYRGASHHLPGFINLEGYKKQSTGPSQGDYPFDLIREKAVPQFDPDQKKIWWGGDWIDWKPTHTDFLYCGPPYYDFDFISRSKDLNDSEKGELVRFLLTVKLWETTPGEKLHTAQWVWHNSLLNGHLFAEALDDLFGLYWREGDDFPESYNFVFPAKFLIRYNTPKDDIPISMEKVYGTPEALSDFENTLDGLFSSINWDEIRLPPDTEILFDRKTSTSYEKVHKVRRPQWKNSLMFPIFETKELVGDRCKVQVYPGGVRDTIIADIRANHSIRWIERVMRHVLENVPESADTLYSSTYQSRLQNYLDKDGYHVLRDIKKCGLTYNTKDLFPIVKRLIEKYKPDKRWCRFDIFKHMVCRDGDNEILAERGYFLGMANHVVTLCNIVISRMARSMSYSHFPSKFVKNTTIVGNDDLGSVFYPACAESRQLAIEYLNNEHEIHASLGNITNRKKSVVKRFGLFYENYSAKGWQKKEALVCNALACAYLAPSIRVAKMYISSQSERFRSRWAFQRLVELANYWGPEFYDVNTELRVSCEIGGWLKQTSFSLSTSLRDLDEIWDDFKDMVPVAYEICRRNEGEPKPEFKTHGWVSNHVYTGEAKKTDPRVQLMCLTDDDILSFYKRLTTYQRRFSSRMITSSVSSKTKWKDKPGIQKSILSTKPWHCIPDSLVGYQTWTNSGYGFILPAESELYRRDNDPITALVNGTLDPNDEIMVWDPKVPAYCIDHIVQTTLWNYLLCSQFSNTGAIPILEYFYRNQIYPMPKGLPYGRTREPPGDIPEGDDSKIRQPCGPTSHFEACKYAHEEIQTEDADMPQLTDINEEMKNALETLSGMVGSSEYEERALPGQVLTKADLEELSEAELLDKILNADDTKFDHTERNELPNDFFDGSDSGAEFPLDLF